MLYPRTTIDGRLIEDNQMVGYKEHMTQVHRILFLSGVITGELDSNNLLLALDTLSYKPIKLIITSPGGEVDTTFLLYDTMKMIKSPIITIGRYCASAATLLLVAGQKRYLYPHAKVMLHLIAGQMVGDMKDFDIRHHEMQKYQNKVIDILVENGVKKSREEIFQDIDRDFWLEPQEAIEYGLADEILTPEIWEELTKEVNDEC